VITTEDGPVILLGLQDRKRRIFLGFRRQRHALALSNSYSTLQLSVVKRVHCALAWLGLSSLDPVVVSTGEAKLRSLTSGRWQWAVQVRCGV
jgi:hypothetical protein